MREDVAGRLRKWPGNSASNLRPHPSTVWLAAKLSEGPGEINNWTCRVVGAVGSRDIVLSPLCRSVGYFRIGVTRAARR
jgi:hypothetical protein